MMSTHLRGMIFDLDGTLVDSQLDFPAIKRDLGLPANMAILEALAELPAGPGKDVMLQKLRVHELRGAECATLFPGVAEMLAFLDERGIPTAVLTRNSRESTAVVLERLGLQFSQVLSREDAPPKPDPAGLVHICEAWNLPAASVAFCGDFVFDLHAGRAAGMTTILYAPGDLPPFADQADHILRCFTEFPAWWERYGSNRETASVDRLRFRDSSGVPEP
jgi:HAD superfamily hydrolase (TIGR01549 family)